MWLFSWSKQLVPSCSVPRPLGSAAQKFMSLVFTLRKNRKYKSTLVNNQHSLCLKIQA